MMTDTERLFPLLTADNWHTWKNDAKILLMDRGLWGFVSETEPELETTSTAKEVQQYNLRKDRSFTTIYYATSPEIRQLIVGETEGCKAWKTLKDYYEPVSKARIIQLLDEFFNMRFKADSESVGLFCARLKAIVKRLQEAGHPLEDLYQGFQLIRYLPPEFQGIVQLIYRWKDEDFNFAKIEAELILEESRLKQVVRDSENFKGDSINSAFGTDFCKNKNVNQFSKGKNVSKFKHDSIGPCYRCGKIGHLKADCVVKVQNPKLNKNKGNVSCGVKNKGYNKFKGKEIIDSNAEVLSINVKGQVDKYSWIIDTGATAHFCNNKDLFVNFRETENSVMTLAVGGIESAIEGIGE